MRVLIISTDAYGGNGGIALYIRDLCEALASMSEVLEVVVVPRNSGSVCVEVPDGIRFVSEASGGKLSFLRSVFSLRHEPFDFVICGHINLLPVAALFCLPRRIPLVMMAFGIDVWRRPKSWFRRRLVESVDAVWAGSEITRDRMQDWSNLSIEKYGVLLNAIHLERYGMALPRQDLLERYGLEGGKVLLTLCRLSAAERYKGIDEVLDLMPALCSHYPYIVYLIAGDGDDQPRLEEKVRKLGLTDHVVFTGFVEEEDKADFYRLADVFLMPGRGEGFGFVFLEAMACGIPVVASRLDGSFEAVRGGELGRAVDPDDMQALQSAILEALKEDRHIPKGLDYFAFPEFKKRLLTALFQVIERKKR